MKAGRALAAKACEIEIDKLGEPIGKQDQYGCALGGLNFIEFHSDDSVTSESVPLTLEGRKRLEEGLVMFYLGGTRSASALLKNQAEESKSSKSAVGTMQAMVGQARELRAEIAHDVDVVGPFVHEGWERKRSLSNGISTSFVDDAYDREGKLAPLAENCWRGNSGFSSAYAPDEARQRVRAALSEYRAYDVRFDPIGTSIIYSD